MFRRAVAACSVALLFGMAAHAEKAPAELQGVWKLESLSVGGRDADLSFFPTQWVIDGDKVSYGGLPVATLAADAKATPKSLKLSLPDSKKTCEGIYGVEGDTLTICMNADSEGVKERPAEFSAKDKPNLRLLELRRDQSEPAGADGAAGFIGLTLHFDEERKAVAVAVVGVLPGCPAEKSGMQKDDLIVKVGGADAADVASTIDKVRQKKPGSEVVLRVRRDGKESDVTVKVGVVPLGVVLQAK